MNSLGLIEVIGFVSAIEASDVCLKAANVSLSRIDKVGKGIVTVSIVGDVGAVKSAVDAAKLAVEKIGTLRSAHVIPRLNSDVDEFLYGKTETEKSEESNIINDKSEESDTSEDEIKTEYLDSTIEESEITDLKVVNYTEPEEDMTLKVDLQIKEQIDSTKTNQDNDSKSLEKLSSDLSKYSVKELRAKIKVLNASVSMNELKKMKKEELIKYFDRLNRKDK